MKRKIIASALALTLAASSAIALSGCKGNDKDKDSTTAPETTVAATTAKETKSSATKSAQSNTDSNNSDSSQSSNSGNQSNDLQSVALNAYGYSASAGYYAVQTGATHNVEGTFNIVAVYDPNGNYIDNVYVHTSGYPVYAGKDVFESMHNDNSVARQDGNDAQSSVASAQTGDNSNDGDYNRAQSYNSQNSINQGGDGRDYADRGY